MTNRRMLIGTVVAAGLIATVVSVQATTSDRRTVMTFNGPVALPGVTLAAGSYTFELITPISNEAVRVSNKQGSVFMSFTERVARPAGLPSDATVRFGEAAPGMVPPIMEWYPTGEAVGHRFIYARK